MRTQTLGAPVLLAGLLLTASACAQVNVNLPWVRATAQKSTAVYLRIEAQAAAAVALVDASSPAAKSAKIIGPKGRPVEQLSVAAGSSLLLKPGSARILLSGVSQPLRRGERLPLTLVFAVPGNPALSLDISAEVVGPHDMSALDQEHTHHHHSH